MICFNTQGKGPMSTYWLKGFLENAPSFTLHAPGEMPMMAYVQLWNFSAKIWQFTAFNMTRISWNVIVYSLKLIFFIDIIELKMYRLFRV